MNNHLRMWSAALLGSLLFGSASFGEDVVSYASIRTQVNVESGPPPATDRPRPKNYFQLAGAADKALCDEVLKAFNEPGRFHGEDTNRWMLDNSHHIDFASMSPQAAPRTQYVFPDLEYARIDVDSDGTDEHVYRLNSVLSSQWTQRLMIVPDELQRHPELLAKYAERCGTSDPRAGCTAPSTTIRFAMIAGVPDRIENEWMFTSGDALTRVSEDPASREQIYVSRSRVQRNLGARSSAYWSLYKVSSRVIAVAAPPPFSFAPPELLVFVPSKERNGDLKCVLMPRAWHKPGATE